jgi:uncharacterized protein YcfL
MKRLLLPGMCLVAALALAGCRSTDTVYVGEKMGGPPYRWVQTDNNLKHKARVISARQDRQNDLLRVQVDLQNTRNRTERIVYRFVWLDAKGIEVSSIQNTWTVRTLGGGETIQIGGIAPDPRVTDCLVKIQEAVR